MKDDQKLSPKYWVAHDVSTDDVLIYTASKSLYDTQCLLENRLGNSAIYDESERYKFILVEIKKVEL